MNIEDVARDTPEALITEPVNIDTGIQPEQARKVASFMGFEGQQLEQVGKFWTYSGYHNYSKA